MIDGNAYITDPPKPGKEAKPLTMSETCIKRQRQFERIYKQDFTPLSKREVEPERYIPVNQRNR